MQPVCLTVKLNSMLRYLFDDLPRYVSRGQRIQSVLEGSGTVDILPGRPDVAATDRDWDKGEKFDPDLDFDPNSFSRMDKFDGVEVGQGLIDNELSNANPASAPVSEEK